jgi:hypothetical protein
MGPNGVLKNHLRLAGNATGTKPIRYIGWNYVSFLGYDNNFPYWRTYKFH